MTVIGGMLPENGRYTQIRATFQPSRLTGVRLWAVITLQTLQWEIGDRSRSWNTVKIYWQQYWGVDCVIMVNWRQKVHVCEMCLHHGEHWASNSQASQLIDRPTPSPRRAANTLRDDASDQYLQSLSSLLTYPSPPLSGFLPLPSCSCSPPTL